MVEPPRFAVITGSPAPDTPAERVRQRMRGHDKPAEMLECRRCAGREFIEARSGVRWRNGRACGGTTTLICVVCLTRGERITVP